MRLLRFIAGLFVCVPLLFASHAYSAEVKLVLKAKMVSVEAFNPDEIVDALDAVSADGVMPGATVVFKIESVVKGNLPPVKVPASSSVWNQTKDAYKEKSFLKMITMDYQNPEVEREGKPRWFAVGVQSPLESFQVVSWSDLPKQNYRLSFSQDPVTGGFILQDISAG
ncbi:MAG TPA: hypothetical protein PLY88_07200 [Candidatus Omnitrophota bacterium]|nr:hypothetical protein [Candidatus Omnitrophota bacterium]